MAIKSNVLIIPFLLLALPFVFAGSPNYDFQTVEINNIIAYIGQSTNLTRNLNIEQLETIDVEITLKAAQNISGGFVDFVSCEARLEGYEFGSIYGRTDVFTVEQGNIYRKTLSLRVPDDIETSDPYTLRIECSDPLDQ